MEEYNVLRQVGKGSYGEVWSARSKKDRKKYVIKKMSLKNISKRENKAAQLEVKLLASLHHPNIVSYKESFTDPGTSIFIVMGFCEGGDMYHLIHARQGVPIGENLVIEWFIQISMALQYIHERNILHRDLKTQNIFLTKSKIIKLGDFGIARVLDSTCQMATTLIGTPYYMSPEIFTNKPYNHKSDVWALGCCLYEMTSLRHPFNAKDMNSLMYKILKKKPPPMPRNYHSDLLALMKSMLSYEPDQRPSVQAILNNSFIRKNIAVFLNETKESIKVPENLIKKPNKIEKNIQVVKESQNKFEKLLPESRKEILNEDIKQKESHEKKKLAVNFEVCNLEYNNENHLLNSYPNENSCAKTDEKKLKLKEKIECQLNNRDKQIPLIEEHFSDFQTNPKTSDKSSGVCDKTVTISKIETEPSSYSSYNVARARRRQKLLSHIPSNDSQPSIEIQKVSKSKNQKPTNISGNEKSDKNSKISKDNKVLNNCGYSRPLPSLPKNRSKINKDKQKVACDQKLVPEDNSRMNELDRSHSDGAIQIRNLIKNENILQNYQQCNKSARQRRREKMQQKIDTCDMKRPKSAPSSSSDNLSKNFGHNECKSSGEMIELITALNCTLSHHEQTNNNDERAVKGEDVLDASIRIESRARTLRTDCLNGVGDEILNKAFFILDSSENEVKQQELLNALLGKKFDEFIGKIWQLKFCENVLIQC
ncbi:Serine/threonine-protein kinase Nek4 [Nymphon striatum]|nr:Serine/threonine-protein kinase Nek4 [Nymphon striatum]